MTFPMPIIPPRPKFVLIHPSLGSNINLNMATNLTAAFDGVTSQTGAVSAQTTSGASTSGYNNAIGKDWGSGNSYKVTRLVLYGPNDTNVLGSGGGTTFKLQGSADGAAWSDLTTAVTFPTGSSQVVTVVEADITTTTAYRYHRVNYNGNAVNALFNAETRFYKNLW